ncbi:MAG TPA: Rrf2 family transcriptional regulator [Candidatus Dormibacteraeota bacterium]|nr:Rrf2 family transcriptional regulator [Candidatus Dormibacteraeota bacterium]
MRLSAKSVYAVRALLELALATDERELMRIEDIARAQGIPERFLPQIMLAMKSAGIVESRRGSQGGYRLARPASAITLADVVRRFDRELFEDPAGGATGARGAVEGALADVGRALEAALAGISLADLVDRHRAAHAVLHYVI